MNSKLLLSIFVPNWPKNIYCTVYNKCSRTPRNLCHKFTVATSRNMLYLSSKFMPEIYLKNSAKAILYGTVVLLLNFCSSIKCRPYFLLGSYANNKYKLYLSPQDMCNNKCSLIIVPTKIFSNMMPRKSCPSLFSSLHFLLLTRMNHYFSFPLLFAHNPR